MPFQVFRDGFKDRPGFSRSRGAVTGKLFPTGQVRNMLHVPGIGHIEVSIVDAANPLLFCRCEDCGLSGQELPEQIDTNPELLQRIGATRAAVGVAIGLAGSIEEAIRSVPSVPKIAFVTQPRPYLQLDGVLSEAADVDLVARIMSMGRLPAPGLCIDRCHLHHLRRTDPRHAGVRRRLRPGTSQREHEVRTPIGSDGPLGKHA